MRKRLILRKRVRNEDEVVDYDSDEGSKSLRAWRLGVWDVMKASSGTVIATNKFKLVGLAMGQGTERCITTMNQSK